jgi:hypothetical protein
MADCFVMTIGWAIVCTVGLVLALIAAMKPQIRPHAHAVS